MAESPLLDGSSSSNFSTLVFRMSSRMFPPSSSLKESSFSSPLHHWHRPQHH